MNFKKHKKLTSKVRAKSFSRKTVRNQKCKAKTTHAGSRAIYDSAYDRAIEAFDIHSAVCHGGDA